MQEIYQKEEQGRGGGIKGGAKGQGSQNKNQEEGSTVPTQTEEHRSQTGISRKGPSGSSYHPLPEAPAMPERTAMFTTWGHKREYTMGGATFSILGALLGLRLDTRHAWQDGLGGT